MANKKVLISIDPDIHKAYREKCEKEGIIMSKQIQIYMEEQIKWKKQK